MISTDNGLSVILNIGDGTFSAPVSFPAIAPVSAAIGDLNGDGKGDLVVGFGRYGTPNGVSVRLNSSR